MLYRIMVFMDENLPFVPSPPAESAKTHKAVAFQWLKNPKKDGTGPWIAIQGNPALSKSADAIEFELCDLDSTFEQGNLAATLAFEAAKPGQGHQGPFQGPSARKVTYRAPTNSARSYEGKVFPSYLISSSNTDLKLKNKGGYHFTIDMHHEGSGRTVKFFLDPEMEVND